MPGRAAPAISLRSLAIALASAAALAGAAAPSTAAPQRPVSDDVVLAIVPAGRPGGSAEWRAARAELARAPEDIGLAVRVARSAIDQGRAWSDPRFYGQAEAALAPWWRAPNPPDEVRVLRAVILQAQHDFRGALADLDPLIEGAPNNAQARLTRAFVRLVMGDLAGAAEDCRSIPRDKAPLPAAACSARAQALTGAAQQAYGELAGALAAAPAQGRGDAMHRFAAFILAEIAASLGRSQDAERLLQEAAAAGAPDVPLLAATADHLLDNGRPGEALALLDGKPGADAVVLRQAIAAKQVGDPRLARWRKLLNERFAAAQAGGVRLHLREEARFRLEVEGEAQAALRLALENWEVQKEPADTRLVLQSALAAGEPAAAAAALRFIRDTGLADARIAPLLDRLEGGRS